MRTFHDGGGGDEDNEKMIMMMIQDFHGIYLSLFVRTGFKKIFKYGLLVHRFRHSLLE